MFLKFYVCNTVTYYNFTNFVLVLYVVPDKVTGVDLVCFPGNMIVECNAEWDVSSLCTFICMHICIYVSHAKTPSV